MPTNWSQQWTPGMKADGAPKVTKPVTSKKTTGMVGGINEEVQSGQARAQYDAGKALRQYQLDAAQRNLARNLTAIDRGALDTYKSLGNNYAARGMLRSGGYMGALDRAQAGVNDQTVAARQELSDVQQQNQLADIQALANLQGIDYNILQQYIAAIMANKINQTGQA